MSRVFFRAMSHEKNPFLLNHSSLRGFSAKGQFHSSLVRCPLIETKQPDAL
jgi:hypothetical protein